MDISVSILCNQCLCVSIHLSQFPQKLSLITHSVNGSDSFNGVNETVKRVPLFVFR